MFIFFNPFKFSQAVAMLFLYILLGGLNKGIHRKT